MRFPRLVLVSFSICAASLALSGCSNSLSNSAAPTVTSAISVSSVVPAANATCVSAATPITITFNEAASAGSVNSTNIVVTGPNGAAIPVTMSMNSTSTQVMLTPPSTLPSGTITVTVQKIGNSSGVMMAAPYTWSFSTACSGGGSGGGGSAQVSFSTTTYASGNLLWDYLDLPSGTAIADLNGDERDDFVTSGFCSSAANGTFSVHLSTGDGAYAPPACYTVPSAPLVPSDFASGDFLGNGHVDIAVEDEQGNVSIWKNAGDGTLTQASTLTTPGGESGIVAADVNHDGKIDLVFSAPNVTTGQGGTLSVFFGNGDGTFSAGPVTPVAGQEQFFDVAAGDFDGDGNVDVVVSDTLGEETEILYGDGTGKFTAGPNLGGAPSGSGNTILTRYEPFEVTTNGIMDLIGSPFTQAPSCGNGCHPPPATGNNYLDLELGQSDRKLSSVKVTLENCTVSTAPPQVGDFDGDGISDIIVAEGPCPGAASGSNTLDFLKGNGDGTFQAEQVVYTTNDSIGEWFVIKASASGKPGLAVYQFQDVNNTVTNPQELIMVNTTP